MWTNENSYSTTESTNAYNAYEKKTLVLPSKIKKVETL